MSLPEEQSLYKEPSSPIGRTQSNLAALFVTPSPKKMDGDRDQAVDDEPFINKRKPSSTMAVKGVLNNGEHTLIPVTASEDALYPTPLAAAVTAVGVIPPTTVVGRNRPQQPWLQ
jgi:hypothetical protein